MTRRILVTGGTGFVGRPVIERLAAAGYDVTCTCRPESRSRLIDLPVTPLLSDDIFAEPADWWAEACAGVDTVLHIAWYAEPGRYMTSDRNIDCLVGTLRLAQGATMSGVHRVVGVGTCFEYDLRQGHLHTDTPLAPQSPYAAAKVAAATMLRAWLAQAGTEFLWARLFYLHGRGEDPRRLVPYLHERLAAGEVAELGDGAAIRDYMDVSDAAEMLVRDTIGPRVGAANICSGVGVTIRELAERVADGYGRRDLLRFGARPLNPADPPVVVGVRTEAEG